jgi:hypothetical protein
MKYQAQLIAAALLVWLFAGCSKHSPAASPKVKDFGIVEVSDGTTNRLDLGGGRVLVINYKSFIAKDQKVALVIAVETKDSGGFIHRAKSTDILASPDQTATLYTGVSTFTFTPHIKQ